MRSHGGVLFADFPLRGLPITARAHCGSHCILPQARLYGKYCCALAQLASLGVGSPSREPRNTPALPSIGPPYVSASPEWSVPWRNFFHARLLVTPKPPPYLRPDNWDSTARDRMHLCNKRACMLSLDWSPCGWPSTTATLPLPPCI